MSEYGTPRHAAGGSRIATWFTGLSGRGKFRLLLVIAALIAAPFAIYAGLDEPNQADKGDCLARDGDSARIVSCSDGAARYKVLARVEGKSESDKTTACAATPGTTDVYYQDGRRFRKGFILCLGETT